MVLNLTRVARSYEYSLHHSHGVLQSTAVLGGLGDTHGRLEKDLDGALGHVIVAVECFVALLAHALDDRSGVGVEEVDETLEDVQVEGRGNQFTVGTPFRT